MRRQIILVASLALGLSGWTPQSSFATANLKPKKSEIAAFLKADVNKDRVLTRKEFRTFVRAMADSGQSTARKIRFFGAYGFAFNIIDKNRDGIVTPLEMRNADDDFRTGK
ncbi:hypothetical protein [Labrenzia sp. CE80]|uniref:hypothetical protein n=1 Tax=Labrenzia sp. CE80 TaxID=1788986 RepID=UPI00129B847B|nr:hypothetical protein [Labrenzia sp. CE80]